MKNKNSKTHRANLSHIRTTHTYSMPELAHTLGKSLSTIQRWKRLGMPTIPDTKPILIDGADFKQWETARRQARKRPSAPDQFYCLGSPCRTQRRAAIGSVIIRKSNSNLGSLEANCAHCGGNLRKGFAMADIRAVEMIFDAYIGNVRDLTKLGELKYIYRKDIRDRDALEANFRQKFETLNRVKLTDSEFSRLLEHIVSADVFACAKILRERNSFERDDGTPLYYTLVNNKDWCKNDFEVINQLRINTRNSHQRYDVILLINGVPVVQIELKALDVRPHRAMQQIVKYKNDPGNGYANTLLCFMQLFIVSNRSNTMYFANNNAKHFSFDADERFLPVYQYADEKNEKITNLDLFAEEFLAKCTLGQTISRYMVLVEGEQQLMMMRPYQVYAVKAIVECIDQNRGNGYIWHTTGSGKTLTSFKASILLKNNDDITKCLFVVDRKDLDRQTREEFNRFQDGCVEQNTNTENLVERLLSTDKSDKVIVTTIQKLGLALDSNHKKKYKQRLEPLRDERMVFIFDECHRSQFGENNKAIKEFFPNAQLFGFTGTPIFDDNAIYQQIEGKQASLKTTASIFKKELHAYTITHAIEDRNVLGFHIDYFKGEGDAAPKPGDALSQQAIVDAILSKHDTATAGRKFNAILATGGINDAIEYHRLFKKTQAAKSASNENFVPLNIACVFSPPAKALAKETSDKNVADIKQLQEDLPQEKADNAKQPAKKKAALKAIKRL